MKLHNLFLGLLLCVTPSWAGAIAIVLTPPTQVAAPGGALTFSGTITNVDFTATVDLININLNLGSGFFIDVTPFFSGPATLSPSLLFANFPLFNVTVENPFPAATGEYFGTIEIFGGVRVNNIPDPFASDFLGSTTFSIFVTNEPAAVVPEPATWQLALAAGASLCFFRQRRRS